MSIDSPRVPHLRPTTLRSLGRVTVRSLALLLLAGCALSADRSAPTGPALLDGETVDAWVTRLTPEDASAAWRSIPWRASFHEGAVDAAEARRPLLLWLMNGHPLGCT